MDAYWISAIIQDTEDSKPWLCSMTDCVFTIEQAMDVIDKTRKNYRVLSAWIEKHNKNKKEIVFHKCYINIFGNITE